MGFFRDRWRRGSRAAREPVAARVTASAAPERPAWDGGWRAVAPLSGVIQRSGIAVGDGLGFRDGLASWRDHRFGGELGHSVHADAPAGLVGGMTGPEVAERSRYSGGGPLLVAWRRESEEAVGPARTGVSGDVVEAAVPKAPRAGAAPLVRRSAVGGSKPSGGGRSTGSSGGGATGCSGGAAGSSGAGAAVESSSTGGAVVGPTSSGGGEAVAAAVALRAGGVVMGSAGSGAGRTDGARSTGGIAEVVRLRPVRPPLTVAGRPVMPVRSLPVVGGAAGKDPSVPVAPAGGRPGPAEAAPRPRSVPVLGEPLTAMPPTAQVPFGAAGSSSVPRSNPPGVGGPTPVVRSVAAQAGGPPAVQRGAGPKPDAAPRPERGTGIGAPLAGLPATATPAGARSPKPAAGGANAPAVRGSAADEPESSPSGGSSSRRATTAGGPVRRAGDGRGPLPGAEVLPPLGVDRPVRRALDGTMPTARRSGDAFTTDRAPAGPGATRLPVVPVTRLPAGEATVQRSPTPAARAGAGTHGGSAAHAAPGGPVPSGAHGGSAAHAAPGGPVPSAAHVGSTGPAADEPHRSTPRGGTHGPRVLPLIAQRPLTTSTAAGLPQPVRRAAGRPVVRPRWAGAGREATGSDPAPTARLRSADRGVPADGGRGSVGRRTAAPRPTSSGETSPRTRWFSRPNAPTPVVKGRAGAHGPTGSGRARPGGTAPSAAPASTSAATPTPAATFAPSPSPTFAPTPTPMPTPTFAPTPNSTPISTPTPISAPTSMASSVAVQRATGPASHPHVQRHVGRSPRPAGSGAPAVVRPTPPRPLDGGPKLPAVARPHPTGVPTPIGRDRASSDPAAPRPTSAPVPVRWSAGAQVQRAPAGASSDPEPRMPGAWPEAPVTEPARSTRPKRVDPDLDELARRLLDPLGRLLRAELRQGRERTGRLHDRRR
ncbi:hypothetical protein [Umezawaea sp.]|uniref:hypothetical protein n=1 Tax=Umezawaea sp. TaxID=1955258 RepID=UPI002ED69FF2